MKKMLIGLLFVILPCFALSSTAAAAEITTIPETVAVEASSDSMDVTVTDTDDYDNWICIYYWECTEIEIEIEFDDEILTIIIWEYYDEFFCLFW
jgi:hypothetical protein